MRTLHRINKGFLRIAVLGIICLSILWECAYKVGPSGGPEDKTPPKIIYTFPSPDSINIKQLSYLEFHFSEGVDKASFSRETWLLPELPHGYEFKWKGDKKLRVILKDSLDKDQTYIFTMGTGVKDLRNNKLPSPFVLPFSTGPKIDKGEILGKVFERKSQGIFIFAYEIADAFSNQTIFKHKPRYYTQTNNLGEFQLKYLKEASYRIYALEDQNGDKKYTLQTDRIGIPFKDVTITPEQLSQDEINFHLIREDTTKPEFVRADAINNRLLQLSFSESLKEPQYFFIEIKDSLNGNILPVFTTVLDRAEPSRLRIYTQSQSDVIYEGMIGAVQDTAGNLSADDSIKFSFVGELEEDTTSAKLLSIIPPDKGKNVDYDSDIKLHFYYPVDSSSLKNSFLFLSPDSNTMAGQWEFASLVEPQFIPDSSLEKNSAYQIQIKLNKVKTIFGDSLGDSVLVNTFDTKDWSQLGEIAGVVNSDNPSYQMAVIWALPIRGNGFYLTFARVNQKYLIQFLPEGSYQVYAGIDVNENGKIDNGSELPFEFSEPFKMLSDTIKVRKRWTTESINIWFQQ